MELVAHDLIGPRKKGIGGHIYVHTPVDVGANYPKVGGIRSQEPAETARSWKEMYPGTRYDRSPTCPRQVGQATGGEREGELRALLEKQGSLRRPEIPCTSETDWVLENCNKMFRIVVECSM